MSGAAGLAAGGIAELYDGRPRLLAFRAPGRVISMQPTSCLLSTGILSQAHRRSRAADARISMPTFGRRRGKRLKSLPPRLLCRNATGDLHGNSRHDASDGAGDGHGMPRITTRAWPESISPLAPCRHTRHADAGDGDRDGHYAAGRMSCRRFGDAPT